ncbi:hypothetical protein [Polyangium fumosum]|uniref:Restriction endonuclease type IV Mrr domain-containing protein n=1 Tax=Polyangium fumosum TaxID=889272 RepID=A0A4U1JFW4_9BACT|nr:hypothetical protein [Polyangium fumosum]TKD08939.1 hypothetical protein E8A74_14235 [Polyangium fumosum]
MKDSRDEQTRSEEYVAKAKALDRDGLKELWAAIKAETTPGWPDGKALEYMVLRAFEEEGALIEWPYDVRWPYRQNENSKGTVKVEQIDGAVYVEHIACIIECKDSGEVDHEPIYKLRSQLIRRPASTIGAIFTSGEYREVARLLSTFMFPQTVLLWTAEEIEACLERRNFCKALKLKYRKALSHGATDHNVSKLDAPKE